MQHRKIVHCFGTYDPTDEVCCGNKDTGEEPCALKDDCNAFTRYLRRIDKQLSEFFKYKIEIDDDGENEYAVPIDGEERFWRFVSNLSRTNKVKKEKKIKKKKRKRKKRKPLSKEGKAATIKAIKKLEIERKAKILGVLEEFKKVLLENLEIDRTFAELGETVSPGQFYVTNRMESSRYIGIFCRTIKGFDIPLIRLRTKTRQQSFDAFLPVSIKKLKQNVPKNLVKQLGPYKRIDIAKFRIEVQNIKAPKVILIAEIIARLINDDIIDLPT